MAQPAEKKWNCAQQIELKLHTSIKSPQATFLQIEQEIHDFRTICQDIIFLDFDYAARMSVGKRLWDAHIMINGRYRKLLDRYRRGDQKKLVVERRKVEKHYADFLKTSQVFYRGYVQRLASHYGGMPRLVRIAACLSLDLASVEQPVTVSDDTARLLESSCHAHLLRLGDLSRYRNMIRTTKRTWEPALGYYSLANELCPESGTAHNQMAIIFLADQDHLDAIYHLYRAATAIEPHPLARGNLELEFKKIIGVWEKHRAKPKMDALETLVWWFVILHAKFYDGAIFSTQKELENEVLSRLNLLLQEQSIDDTLHKLVLISISAQSTAITRINEEGGKVTKESLQSFYFCLGFNIHMMSILLQVLLPELSEPVSGEEIANGIDNSATDTSEQISARARRVIPALRQYSIWLASCHELVLNIPPTEATLKGHIANMWILYATVLTRMANFFPIFDFIPIQYLLEEDANTVGFEPFRNSNLSDACNFYSNGPKTLKPLFTDLGVERHHPNLEMHSRVLDIVVSALSLVNDNKIPLHLGSDGKEFIYIGENFLLVKPAEFAPPVSAPNSPTYDSSNIVQQLSINRDVDCPTPHGYGSDPKLSSYVIGAAEDLGALDSNQSMDNDMHRMVDDLLDCHSTSINETSYGMHSATANEVFAHIGSGGYGHRLQSTPTMLPSLPGLFTTAFTPQANELQPTSPLRPGTARQVSPLSLSTKEKRLSAATALDEITGFGGNLSGSWGRRSARLLSNPVSQSVNQALQDNLTQQFMPSSVFTESSSLYPDATQQRFVGFGAARAAFSPTNGNNSTVYPGASDFEQTIMLQSSIWNGGQPASFSGYVQTPPGGQGG